MRTIKSFAALLFAATFMLVSCNKEDVNGGSGNVKPAQLTIKLAGVVKSKAIEAPGVTTPGTITLTNGQIFILDPQGNVSYTEPLIVGAVANSATSASGQVLAKDVPSDSRVYIVGNIPAGSTVASLTTLTAIKADSALMTTQTDYTKAALANVNGTPEPIVLNGAIPDVNNQTTIEATVTVTINPLISRLELGQITGSAKVTGFTVAGVYVDSWYPSFTYGGSYAGAMFVQAQDTVLATNPVGEAGSWAATQATPADPFIAVPAAGKVWAYNVASGGLPRFIIKLTDVKYMADTDGNPLTPDVEVTSPVSLYLTVTGYTGVTTFERGKIYNIGGNAGGTGTGITFTPDDPGFTPNPVDVTLQVNVNIKEWEIVYPDAIL